jgi:hypothetical protein
MSLNEYAHKGWHNKTEIPGLYILYILSQVWRSDSKGSTGVRSVQQMNLKFTCLAQSL